MDRGGRRRVVVTGLGVLASCGIGKEAFFAGLAGAPAEGPQWIDGFDPADYFDPKEARQTDRFAQLSVAAAQLGVHVPEIEVCLSWAPTQPAPA